MPDQGGNQLAGQRPGPCRLAREQLDELAQIGRKFPSDAGLVEVHQSRDGEVQCTTTARGLHVLGKLASFALIAGSMVLAGCATFTLYMPEREEGPDYVIVKTIGSTEKVFDCYSAPNGEVWDPTCVRVRFRQAGIEQEKRGVRTEERVDDYEDRRKKRRGGDDDDED